MGHQKKRKIVTANHVKFADEIRKMFAFDDRQQQFLMCTRCETPQVRMLMN